MSYRDDSRSPPRGRSGYDRPGPSGERLPTLYRSTHSQSRYAKLNVLEMMETYKAGPMQDLYRYMNTRRKIRVWTRDFHAVCAVLSGYIIAFDKHWNLILHDVDEACHLAKKCKIPFLRDLEPNEELPDMAAKVPRIKKEVSEPPPQPKEPKDRSQKKKRRAKTKEVFKRRNHHQLFIRGANIVMITPMSDEEEDIDEEDIGEEGGS